MFSWSYYGTSDGIEANTRDSYTEHVMRIQWGKTADTMISWMVARRSDSSHSCRRQCCYNWKKTMALSVQSVWMIFLASEVQDLVPAVVLFFPIFG